MQKRIMTYFFMVLAAVMIWRGHVDVLANANNEEKYDAFLEKDGQWIVENAWNSENSTVDYCIEFYPDDYSGRGELVWGYKTSLDNSINYWYGNYCSYGPAGSDEGWVYQYSLESPEGVRSGSFLLEIDDDNLILTEDTGDCFWAFSSNSSETMVFEEVQILDGDGYVYEESIEDGDYYINNNLAVHRQILLDTDSMCGAIYLGYVDSSYGSLAENRAYLEELLFMSGYTDDFEFLMDIPDDHIVEVDGGMELYCIYPFDEMASVTVNKYVVDENTYQLVQDEVLYRSDYGDPILVRCNATESFWDAEVYIVDSNDYRLSWMPRMRMMDGRMEVPEEAPYVYDATWYDEEYVYEDFYTEDISYFTVVNCEEWVSLRSEPDVNSICLTEVPLNSFVLDCGESVNGINYVSFAGAYGYIKSDYLEAYTEESVSMEDLSEYEKGYEDDYVQPASTLPLLMTYDEIQLGEYEVLNYTYGDFTVFATVTFSDEDGEILKIGGFREGEPLWGYISNVPYLTELDNIGAFIAGTAQDPQVIIFNAEAGMLMVDMFFGDILWEISSENLQVGGSICLHVTEDGTIYCSGYYDDGPTAISADGNIIWRAQKSNPDIYWACGIEAESDLVLVDYATGNDEGSDVVAFDINDGTERWHDIRPYY